MELKDFDKEHAIPQDISAYQFRLVGDMTIKQFMQVAAGALISLLLYSSGIPPYVKWPLIILSFLAGIALAFFPIENRPLGKWISLFLKAIYSPTIYRWQSGVQRVSLFQPEPQAKTGVNNKLSQGVNPNQTIPSNQQVSKNQGQPDDSVTGEKNKKESDTFDESEVKFLNKVDQVFAKEPATVNIEKLLEEKENLKKGLNIPQNKNVDINAGDKPIALNQTPNYQASTQVSGGIKPLTGQNIKDAKSATFSQQAAPPAPPTKANVIVGQAIDEEGNIIDNVILEIKDSQGRPIRALKSNRLGHFMIVTPLINGSYQISSEKDGYKFESVNIEANDTIIPPIAIKGQKIN